MTHRLAASNQSPHDQPEPTCVAAVVVTFFPEPKSLFRLLAQLIHSCDQVIVVDNGSPRDLLTGPASEKLQWLYLTENKGIGFAQNRGIDVGLANNATHLLLLDQDSMPSDSMVQDLLAFEQQLLEANQSVAAVGPQLTDIGTGKQLPFITFRWGFKRRVYVTSNQQWAECFSLLSSGSLIRADVIKKIGLMNEELFLEYVDVEWGGRARSQGYHCFGTGSAKLNHSLGDSHLKVVGKLNLPLHRPERHYYTMRNAILMQRCGYLPVYWKKSDLLRTLFGFLVFATLNRPRRQQVRFMLLGLYHGFVGKTGPLKLE